jgi:hypothetical protein
MIPVIWYKGCRGNWDAGLLCSIFDKHKERFPQTNTTEFPALTRAIVIVAGRPDPEELHDHLLKLHSGVVILTSEEDSFFNWQAAIPKHLGIWTQYYSPNKEALQERILLGPPNRIKDYRINSHLPKKYAWSFVGQVQNPFRQECVEVLKNFKHGFLHVAEMFGGVGTTGMEYQDYLDIMCQSKYVICPAGSMCVDSFRLYEAIECGAIPITDRRAPRDHEDFNYWDSVYPEHDIVTVSSWKNLGYFLEVLEGGKIHASNYWWTDYKDELEKKLINLALTL